MTTAVYTHDDCLNHVTPEGHPERVARLEAVARALEGAEVERREAPMGTEDDVRLCHPEAYRKMIETHGAGKLDADTYMSEVSYAAAMRAVGGTLAAIDAVMAGELSNAFVATRPPGHHAETAKPMGFCLFGHVAIGAKHLMERHGLSRVAVVDFDVHHGNGTQDLLWDEPRALFVTSQQMPLWPGSGDETERGAHGNIMNLPLEPRSGGQTMRRLYERTARPARAEFKPLFVLVSAGFDAHASDPLAQLEWTEPDFAWLTEQLWVLADAHCGGKLVSVLEGGYDLAALGASARAHVDVLARRGR